MRIAYLTSLYARATDTFIRDEVAQLRVLGDEVATFSIRRPEAGEQVSAQVRAEQGRTTYLLDAGRAALGVAVLVQLLRRPFALARAAAVARELARPGLKGRLWPWFYLAEACLLAGHLRRRRIEHLHDHIGEGSAAVAMLASILTGVPYSLTIHGPSEWDRPWELSLDVKARHASFVAVISAYTRGQLLRWIAPEDWPKVRIVRCGLRLEEYVAPDPGAVGAAGAAPGTTVVSVGRLAPEKGHLILLQALAGLADRPDGLRVVLVGDGPERSRLESHVRDHGLTGVVDFVGWKTSDEVRAIVRTADCLVMPSFAEGLPVSIMEALALGVPVISSDVAGVSELVRPGRSGWLVPSGSAEALCEALAEFLATSGDGRRELGARGREDVIRQHDLAHEVGLLRGLMG